MNPKLIAEIAKFLGKNIKWVVVIITTLGTGAVLGILHLRKQHLEKEKKRAVSVVQSCESKIIELENKQKQIQDEHSQLYKENAEHIQKLWRLCQKQQTKIEDLEKKLAQANDLIERLKR